MRKIPHYNVIFDQNRNGFTAVVLGLSDRVIYGENLNETKKMAADAIKGCIVSLKKHREAVLTDEENFFASTEIEKVSVYA